MSSLEESHSVFRYRFSLRKGLFGKKVDFDEAIEVSRKGKIYRFIWNCKYCRDSLQSPACDASALPLGEEAGLKKGTAWNRSKTEASAALTRRIWEDTIRRHLKQHIDKDTLLIAK